MKNRYILDPSGQVIRVKKDNSKDPINVAEDFNNIERGNKDVIYKNLSHFANNDGVYHETYFGSQNEDLLRVDIDTIADSLSESFGNKVKYLIENDYGAFGFINDKNIPQVQTAFRQLNSFLNNDTETSAEGTDVIPFVDEFEFYTGVRESAVSDNGNLLTSSLAFIIDYLADVAIEAGIVEALMALNKTSASNSKKGNRLEGLKNNDQLILGEYILDEVDVFSKYFFEVLNYPIEERKVSGSYFLKRVSCYFIGLTEWIVQDRVIDWQRILEKLSGSKSLFGDYSIGLELDTANTVENIALISENVLDVFISSLLNSSSLKRIMLLLKKFHTQKYWVNNQLYSAKRNTKENVIIDSFNYYYFKFFIERVNVGIKIWNRNISFDSIKNSTGNSSNRLTGEIYSKGKKDTIVYNKDRESAEIQVTTAERAAEGQTIGDLAREAAGIKKDDTRYEFNYNFNDLSLSNIPTALMFNKSITNVVTTAREGFSANSKKFFAKTENYRLPIELVNKIEGKLEAEYMPFYLHDIRTNEILSFHAFIENISDSYSPEYTSTGGFGRIDDVKSYVKTTRSISLTFTVAAMNKEDHQTMWYYINKLVTMVYPQWTRGEDLTVDNLVIQQPFSQVPGNSPLIRLRIGDLIKSNYSRFNLARIFGLDEAIDSEKVIITKNTSTEIDIKKTVVNFTAKESSAKSNYKTLLGKNNITKSEPFLHKLSLFGKEKYVLCFKINDVTLIETPYGFFNVGNIGRIIKGTSKRQKMPFTEKEYNKFVIESRSISESNKLSPTVQDLNYTFLYNKNDIKYQIVESNKKVKKDSKEILEEIRATKNTIMKPFDDKGNINNPITQSYESGMSKGLAGHITQLDLNYNDATWEIEKESKAPMMVKVTVSFAPIHDIPPGLDYKGMPRAVNYNVGDINLSMFGDPLQKYKGEE